MTMEAKIEPPTTNIDKTRLSSSKLSGVLYGEVSIFLSSPLESIKRDNPNIAQNIATCIMAIKYLPRYARKFEIY